MRTAPAFWWREHPTVEARLLQPVGAIWGAIAQRRMRWSGSSLSIPVVCIGNFVAGGAGKTPTALAFGALLSERGHHPAFVSRGYGRRTQGRDVLRVDSARHDADVVGDEPLLLAALAPTYVASDRVAAAKQAITEGATVLILDDGLQSRSVATTVSIAVVDGATGVGNGLALPAGPLRAPLSAHWPIVTAVCVIGDGQPGQQVARIAASQGCPVLRGRLTPAEQALLSLRGKSLLAFAGIGRPEKFFATLRDEGLDVRATQSFPDHHRYSEGDRSRLQRMALASELRLVTTSKDAMRLPQNFDATVLPVELVFEPSPTPKDLLDRLDRLEPSPSL